MTKKVLTGILIMVATLGYSQSKVNLKQANTQQAKVENIKFVVEVDSAEDLEATFKLDDVKSIVDMSGSNEPISVKIVCNGKESSNGVTSSVSYKVDGNTEDIETFMEKVKKIRNAAIKYYSTK